MKTNSSILTLPALLLFAAVNLLPQNAAAHCQVPCGIFTDQLRFEAMLEDTTTIAKAIDQVSENLAAMADEPTPLVVNQLSRWISTKEDHANHIQKVIADYFMAQRIKTDADNYVEQLKAAHAVMQAAMKVKQDAAPEKAEALKNAIFDLYRAYEGKEPDFKHEH